MRKVSLLDIRLDAEKILTQVQKGQRMILTRRGKPVARLEPIGSESIDADDPFYKLAEIAASPGESLNNREIDEIVYGQ